MRRNLLALALIGASVCLSTAAQPLKRSIIKADKVTSKILGQDVPYNVYLPSGYDESKSYPIIYLLHGLSDTYVCWDKKGRLKDVADELIGCGELRPVVIITPNAGD
ncbi:MAG: esterase family protein, partial [Bacteroidales bacterium]|nr:esterase family protein [Bacteroidales bacterium]